MNPGMSYLQDLLTTALKSAASDLHLIAGMPPLLRVHTDSSRATVRP